MYPVTPPHSFVFLHSVRVGVVGICEPLTPRAVFFPSVRPGTTCEPQPHSSYVRIRSSTHIPHSSCSVVWWFVVLYVFGSELGMASVAFRYCFLTYSPDCLDISLTWIMVFLQFVSCNWIRFAIAFHRRVLAMGLKPRILSLLILASLLPNGFQIVPESFPNGSHLPMHDASCIAAALTETSNLRNECCVYRIHAQA